MQLPFTDCTLIKKNPIWFQSQCVILLICGYYVFSSYCTIKIRSYFFDRHSCPSFVSLPVLTYFQNGIWYVSAWHFEIGNMFIPRLLRSFERLWLSVWKHSNQGFDFDDKNAFCFICCHWSRQTLMYLFDFLNIMDFILRTEHHTEKWEC